MDVKPHRKDKFLLEDRFLWANGIIIMVIVILAMRLWFIQILNGDHYAKIAEHNRIRKVEIQPPRGIIYDRTGKIILGNRPFLDLVLIPQFSFSHETTFKILSHLLHVSEKQLFKKLRAGKGQPKFRHITLVKNLTLHQVSLVESNKVFLPGIEIRSEPRRDYSSAPPAHVVGYLGQISGEALQRMAKKKNSPTYFPGDQIGKQGLESRWERFLRGERGYEYIQVDSLGRKKNLPGSRKFSLPSKPAIPGSDLVLTLDIELQAETEKAFQGKNGSVVVLDPRNGHILSLVSSPSFDPAMYQRGLSQEKWQALITDPFKPLFDKTTGGEFPPGSLYKPIIAMAALEEELVTPHTKINCTGSYTLGKDTFHCHNRAGHGAVNLKKSLQKSCDVYYYELGVELGVDRIAKYAKAFGLGSKLGVKLNRENNGLIPTSAWKKLTKRLSWTTGDTPNISIGQGSNLMTPIQMANLYATIANRGKVYRPQLVEKIVNHIGEEVLNHQPEMIKLVDIVSPATYDIVNKALESVVMSEDGTGKNARVEGIRVAGKTGSVQVVSLKKNRNQVDVSMKWKEHAMFAAYAPSRAPEIALAVVSENDNIGGGGKSAAPVAQKIIDAYFKIQTARKAKMSLKQ